MQRQLTDRGISLIEMVVAVLILSIGIVAGFQSLSQARIGIGGEYPRLIAQQVVLNRAEELQLIGAGAGASLPSEVALGGIIWAVSVEDLPTEGGFVQATVSATAPSQPGAVITVFAPIGPPQ